MFPTDCTVQTQKHKPEVWIAGWRKSVRAEKKKNVAVIYQKVLSQWDSARKQALHIYKHLPTPKGKWQPDHNGGSSIQSNSSTPSDRNSSAWHLYIKLIKFWRDRTRRCGETFPAAWWSQKSHSFALEGKRGTDEGWGSCGICQHRVAESISGGGYKGHEEREQERGAETQEQWRLRWLVEQAGSAISWPVPMFTVSLFL